MSSLLCRHVLIFTSCAMNAAGPGVVLMIKRGLLPRRRPNIALSKGRGAKMYDGAPAAVDPVSGEVELDFRAFDARHAQSAALTSLSRIPAGHGPNLSRSCRNRTATSSCESTLCAAAGPSG